MKQEHIQLTHKKSLLGSLHCAEKGKIFASEQQLRNNYFLMLPLYLGHFLLISFCCAIASALLRSGSDLGSSRHPAHPIVQS